MLLGKFTIKFSWKVLGDRFCSCSGVLDPHVLHEVYNEYGNELLASNDTEQPVGNSTK